MKFGLSFSPPPELLYAVVYNDTTLPFQLAVPPNTGALLAAMNAAGVSTQNMAYMPPVPTNQQSSGAGPIRTHPFHRPADNRFNPMAEPGLVGLPNNSNGSPANASLFGKSGSVGVGVNSAASASVAPFEAVDDAMTGVSSQGMCDHPVANTKGVGVVAASNANAAGSSGERYVLYVYNIGNKMDDEHLFYMFVPFGNVLQANVARDKETSEPKNYGFVTFSSYTSALKCINTMNGFILSDKVLQVSFKK